MKRILPLLLSLVLMISAAYAEAGEENGTADYARLLTDLSAASEAQIRYGADSSEYGQALADVDADLDALEDPLADAIAAEWKTVYLDPGFTVLIHGEDDPAELPVTGRHAFVVLGFRLENGDMTDELKARCDAAAEAARAFPDSILVCTGGATGYNNPENHTEAGLMKRYLTGVCGIDEACVYTDEQAMSTVDNAVNTFGILKANGIEQFTLVTSSYHQKRASVLYRVLAEITYLKEGYRPEAAGNFSNYVETDAWTASRDAMTAAFQLKGMLEKLLPSRSAKAE